MHSIDLLQNFLIIWNICCGIQYSLWEILHFVEGAMEHRHFPNSFRTEMEQGHDRNHLTSEQPYIHMGRAVAPENGSLVYPMDNMLRGGVHCASPWNSESRANEYPSSSFSMEVSHFQPAFSGPIILAMHTLITTTDAIFMKMSMVY
ncbi:hypothetical protein CsSME_00028373 [Camellia sinensis var. sinensis]